MLKKQLCLLLIVTLFLIHFDIARGASEGGPENDRHNTVYSYNISEVSLDSSKKLEVTMSVYMCPYCNPDNNYVKVTIQGIGTQSVTNVPVAASYTKTFTFDGSSLQVGDIVQVSSDVWCSWCGHWYDSATYQVEWRFSATEGLGRQCYQTLVRIGSEVNVASGNLYQEFSVSPDPRVPIDLSYNSRSSQLGKFGYGWNDGMDERILRKKDGSVVFVGADGGEELFTANGDGTFTAPAGNHSVLTESRTVAFTDDVENGVSEWMADSPWGITNTFYHSPGSSWTDSPDGNYENSIHKALTLNLNLAGLISARISFWHRYVLEQSFDYGYLEVSTDSGATWTMLKSYTGSQNDWAQETVDLTSYAGEANFLIRFRLITDSSITRDGWYLDDIEFSGVTGYVLQTKMGQLKYYNEDGCIVRIKERNDNEMNFTYENGILKSITTANGLGLEFTNDTEERITSIADKSGRTTTFEYDDQSNLLAIKISGVKEWRFSYDDSANMIKKVDPTGRKTEYEYDEEDRVISSSDNEDQKYSIVYSDSNVTMVGDPSGNLTSFTYTDSLIVTEKVDPLGNITKYSWDSDLNKTGITDSLGSSAYTYDEQGNVLTATDALGNVTAYQYDSYGNVTSMTDPEGRLLQNVYDEQGNLTATTDTTGRTTLYKYDSFGRVIQRIEPNGGVYRFAYDTYGNLLTVTNPLGLAIKTDYDNCGNIVTITDPNENKVYYEYDTLNQPIRIIDQLGNATQYTYDENGNVTSTTDANGNTAGYEYNQYGKVVKKTDPSGKITQYTYSFGGCGSCGTGGDLLDSIIDANGNVTKYEYNGLGQLIKEIDALGRAVSYTYDSNGNVLSKTNRNGHATKYGYDALSRLVGIVDPLQGETVLSYSPTGRITAVTDPNDNTTAYEYNARGLLELVVSPDTGTTAYEYYDDGQIKTIRQANGSSLTYHYDPAGRTTKVISNNTEENIEYFYDWAGSENGLGRLAKMIDPSGVTVYNYDKKGRLVREDRRILNNNYATGYQYDKADNLKSIRYPGGRLIEYAYNNLNQPVRISSLGDRMFRIAEDFSYDPVGNNLSYQLGNGIISQRDYDANYRVKQINYGRKMNLAYDYDWEGNVVALADGADRYRYEYDANDQLVAFTSPGANLNWTYDANGNRLTQSIDTQTEQYFYTANRLQSILNAPKPERHTLNYKPDGRDPKGDYNYKREYFYDPSGNMIGDGNREFVYNANRQLAKVLENRRIIAEYVYDGSGRRVIKKLGPVNKGRDAESIVYHYDQSGNLLAETTGDGRVIVDYVYNQGQPLAMIREEKRGHTETFFFQTDHLGVARTSTDQQQDVVWNTEFDPFGNELAADRKGKCRRDVENNLRFPGQYYDAETGLHYNYRRTYDPRIGRYVQVDPIGIQEGTNHLYLYALSNPLRFKDPNGLVAGEVCTNITIKRKHIHLFGDDKYGHWWVEVNGNEVMAGGLNIQLLI